MFAFGKLAAIRGHQQRQVSKLWRLDACRPENQNVFERVGQVILTANDVTNAQIGVVGAGSQVISGSAITAQEREVFDIVERFFLLAINQIGKFD